MGKQLLALLVIFGLIGCCKCNGYTWEGDHIKEIHVGGKVLCQDCSKDWNHWVNGSSPIKGARVAILCMDERKRVVYYASDETDQVGDFQLVVDRNIHGKKLVARLCSVRLLSSPDQQCDVMTDFAGGKSGAWLTQPLTVYRDTTQYRLGPFYFTSPMCEQPDTDGDVEEEGKNRF